MTTTTSWVAPAPAPALVPAPAPVSARRRRPVPLLVPVLDALAALLGIVAVHLPGPPPGVVLLAGLPVLWVLLLASTGVPRAGALLALTGAVAWAGGAPDVTPLRGILLVVGLSVAAVAVRRLDGLGVTRVVVLGDGPALDAATAELRRVPGRFELVGAHDVCDGDPLAAVAGEVAVDAVVVLPGSGLDAPDVRRLGWALERQGVELYVGTGLLDVCPARTSLARAGGLGLVRVHGSTRTGPRRLLKAIAERVLAGVALVLLGPLLVALMLVVRGTSRGPALFRQTRVGRDGRPFTMLKLRTMVVGDDQPDATLTARNEVAGGVLFKLRQDPRVTPVGRLLRRYSLDELPQLVNVLRGEMALVGPRPALPQEVERYAADPRRRLAVRPGLTGLWQVSGRSDLSWEDSVRLDLSYVDNWSLGLDLSIALRTVRAVVGHRGAY